MTDMRLPAWFGPFAPRPRLVAAAGVGAVAGLACRFGFGLHPSTCLILAWDTLCVTYVASLLLIMAEATPQVMRARAAQDDQGRATILTLVLTAAVAAIAAVALELSLAKGASGAERGLRVTLAFATVAASWLMVHMVFALHYAHRFYDQEDCGDAGGLNFPGGEPPDYWDFLHFALIIGVASQTADIAISAKPLRRLNTVHALFAFAFNTVIVALTINLLAGLFG
jgi:uncharacterized membrane protein